MSNAFRLAAFVSLVGACGSGSSNSSGNTEATDGGDTSNQAMRGSPLEELQEACGDGFLTNAGLTIGRKPYLQQVTSTSARIGWVSLSQDNEGVSITLPDGTPVMAAGAVVDEAAVRVGNQRQQWATISGLLPDTIYCYDIEGSSPLMARAGFRTAPAADSDAPVRFLAFGDSGGGGEDQYQLLEQMMDFPYEVMIHTGDIAYDNGTLAEFESNVFGVYADLFRSIPFFPAAGNHEYNSSANAAPFNSVFSLPGTTKQSWYSFDWGPVHFAALDTEADYAKQIAWLDADLAASDRAWKVVYLHRPPYSTGEHGSDTGLRAKLAPVVEARHVQLVLAGHDHDYERMLPQNGVNYVVTGGGGKGTRPVGKSGFTAYSADVIHFVYGEVDGNTMTLHAVDATGKEFDSLVIAR